MTRLVLVLALAACSDKRPSTSKPVQEPVQEPAPSAPTAPQEEPTLGEQLVSVKGCLACHSLDGKPRVGPTFKGMWGRIERGEVELADGSKLTGMTVEAYIREELMTPAKRVVKGYPPAAPSYEGQLTDQEVGAIMAYLETL